jgi:hypothetical protein
LPACGCVPETSTHLGFVRLEACPAGLIRLAEVVGLPGL